MSHQERIELIREIKELLILDYESRINSYGSLLDEETIKIMKSTLKSLVFI